MAANNVFHVVRAEDLEPKRDLFVGLPVECNNKQVFHRIPVRSSVVDDDRQPRVQLFQGSHNENVVQSIRGLRRLLLRFPRSFVPGLKTHHAETDGDRANITLGFAMYDHRTGPTEVESRVMHNIDALSAFLKTTMLRCDKIRCPLKLGPANMPLQQQQVAADMLDLCPRGPTAAADGPLPPGRAPPVGGGSRPVLLRQGRPQRPQRPRDVPHVLLDAGRPAVVPGDRAILPELPGGAVRGD